VVFLTTSRPQNLTKTCNILDKTQQYHNII